MNIEYIQEEAEQLKGLIWEYIEENAELSELALLSTNEVTEIRNALTKNDNFGENLPTLEILIRVLEQDNYNIEQLTQQNKQMRETLEKVLHFECEICPYYRTEKCGSGNVDICDEAMEIIVEQTLENIKGGE